MDSNGTWFIDALTFAQAAHAGQVDKAGEPYLNHVTRVARRLVDLFPDATREQVQAAVLHDTIEDTNVTREALEARFGARVAAIVAALTKPPGAIYSDYIATLAASGDVNALRVKIADLADNSDPTRDHPDRERMIREKYGPARAALEAALARSPAKPIPSSGRPSP